MFDKRQKRQHGRSRMNERAAVRQEIRDVMEDQISLGLVKDFVFYLSERVLRSNTV